MASVILLLEDEPLILMDLEFAAQDLGCEVLLAATPQEAFEHIKTHGARLNVAVLDVLKYRNLADSSDTSYSSA